MQETVASEKFRIGRSLALPGLVVRETSYDHGCELPLHEHSDSRLVLILSGAFTEVRDHRLQTCRSSMLLFRPAGERHSDSFQSGPATCLVARLNLEWMRRFDAGDLWTRPLSCEGGGIRQMALRLRREIRNRDSLSPLATETLVLELLIHANRISTISAAHPGPGWLKKVKDLIHERFRESLTISRLAAEMEVHPVHLTRTFAKHFGCAPGDYIRNLRMDYACRLLQSTDRSLSDIAAESGFSDQSHFSRSFKRHTGETPLRFRMSAKRV